MKKADLKTGMIVEVKNGNRYLVMLNQDYQNQELVNLKTGMIHLSFYDEDLTVKNYGISEWDIEKVYTMGSNIDMLFSRNKEDYFKLIWERESHPVEMTIAEIEEKLGVKNLKIVKENEYVK